MTDLKIKYSRAENGIDVSEVEGGPEAIVDLRRRNGMTKLEKVLLACTVVFVITSAVFASLYASERQYRNVRKDKPSSENGSQNCKGLGKTGEEEKKETCDLNPNNSKCTTQVVKQAALGKNYSQL